MTGLEDTHCHLTLPEFATDLPAVLQRAADAGVTRVLVPALDLETAHRGVQLVTTPPAGPRLFAAVGIHPNEVGSCPRPLQEAVAELHSLAAAPAVVAIGEIGLDYYWDRTPIQLQLQWLEAQLELAADLQLPVILHNREAKPGADSTRSSTEDLLHLLTTWQPTLAAGLRGRCALLHSYSGTAQQAQRAVQLGCRLGIAGPVTFKNASEYRELVAGLPLDQLLVETDAPYLTPHPHRGTRNEPARVTLTAATVADLHGLSPPQFAQVAARTAAELLRW